MNCESFGVMGKLEEETVRRGTAAVYNTEEDGQRGSPLITGPMKGSDAIPRLG